MKRYREIPYLASAVLAALVGLVGLEIDFVGEVIGQFDILLLHECLLGYRLESLLHIDIVLRRTLEVRRLVLGLAPTFSSLPTDSPGVAEIRLVAYDDEGEIFGVSGRGLDEELVPPVVQGLEG